MHKYLSKPARRWAYSAVVVLLASALFWVSCSEKQPASTGPEQAVALSASDLGRVVAVQNRHTDQLMAIDGVVGTAAGLSAAGKPVVKVYAEREGVAGIPSTVDGISVEVEVTGKFYALALTKRYRPVPIGVSVGNNNECAAGTIGCVVEKGGQKYILSNNHVLARQNAAAIGEDIVQPGRYDTKPKCTNKVATDKVADLSAFVPIVFSTSANNRVDAAIALFSTTDFTCATLPAYYGFPSSTTAAATVGLAIKKVGRTSSLTTGTVTAINATVNVGYPAGTARFTGQIITTGISRSGDSGSLVVTNDSNNNPVGLLYAGSSTTTVLNSIDEVLSTSQMGNLTICSQ